MKFRRLASSSLALFLTVAAARPLVGQERDGTTGEHVRVRVAPAPEDSYARTRFTGTLLRLDADSLVLQDGRRRRTFARRRVERLDVREPRHSRRDGALRYGIPSAVIGAFVGAMTGAVVGGASTCDTSVGGSCYSADLLPAKETAVTMGVASGLLGAWYGATAGRWGWVRRDVGTSRIGLHSSGSGIGLSIAFGAR